MLGNSRVVRQSVARRASDVVRPVIPILGTGFNRWLIGGLGTSPTFTRWNSLLRHLALAQNLLPNPKVKVKLEIEHRQPFVWESFVLASVAREWTENLDGEDFHLALLRDVVLRARVRVRADA
jgi:hypothetical protein